MAQTYESDQSYVGHIHSIDPITAFGQEHVNFDNIIPCPNVIEEDSSGGNLSLASDKDFDDFDDSMTIDPTLFAEYDGDVPHLPSLDSDDDSVMAPLLSPLCRLTESENKKRTRNCFEEDECPSKRHHFDFHCDILPPLPVYKDCDPSLVNSILVSDEESEIEQLMSDDRSVDTEVDQHPDLQLLMEEQLRCLISTIRESERTRAQILNQVEHLPGLYSPYQNGVLADTDLDTFFDTQDSAEDTMAFAFNKLYTIRKNSKQNQKIVFTD